MIKQLFMSGIVPFLIFLLQIVTVIDLKIKTFIYIIIVIAIDFGGFICYNSSYHY